MDPQFEDETPVNPFDMWEGANFKMKIANVAGYRNYDRSEFAPAEALHTDDNVLEGIYNKQYALSDSIYNHTPKVGDMIFFPNYLMHTAYPFNVDGERRSFSFNIDIDKKTLEKING